MNINTGIQEYNLGGKVVVKFNPTDMEFGSRLNAAMTACVEREERLQKEIEGEDVIRMFELSAAASDDIAKIIDGVFGVPVVEPLCEGVSVRAWADGMPIWANIIMAVLDVMDASQDEAIKASKKRVEKYTKKYGK